MRVEIRELKLGEILDHAISLTKNHFGSLFGVITVTLLPLLAIQVIATVELLPEVSINMDDLAALQDDLAALNKAQQEHSLLFNMLNLASVLVYPIVNASLIHMLSRAYLGSKTSIGSAIGSSFKSIIPLYWTWILMFAAIMGGLILLIIPGILAICWFTLASQVVVIEKVHGFAAMKRSRELMRGNIFTFIVMNLVLFIIAFAIGFAGGMIPSRYGSGFAGALIQCVVTILSSAATVVFYFSARCKNEQFDLQLLAQDVGLEDGAPTSDGNSVSDSDDATADTPFLEIDDDMPRF